MIVDAGSDPVAVFRYEPVDLLHTSIHIFVPFFQTKALVDMERALKKLISRLQAAVLIEQEVLATLDQHDCVIKEARVSGKTL